VAQAKQAATALTADLIVSGSPAADPVISPDGKWVAWTASPAATREQRVSELWLAPADGSASPVRVTDGSMPDRSMTDGSMTDGSMTDSSARARLPRWSRDSGWLFYVAGEGIRRLRVTDDGPTADRPTADGEAADETTADGEAAGGEIVLRWTGEISVLAPLAGGRFAAVAAGDERTGDDKRRETEGDDVMAWSERHVRQHWLWHRLRLLDLVSGEFTVVTGLAGRHVTDIAQRPDGGPLAVMSWECPEYEPGVYTSRLHIVGLDDGTATDLTGLGAEACSPAWWKGADGWHVAWREYVPSGNAMAVLDLAVEADGTAAGEPVDLTAGMPACPDTLAQVTGGPPTALFAEGLDTALYRLDPAGAAGPEFRRVTGWPGRATALSVSDDAAAIAVLASTAYTPLDVSAGPPDALVRVSDTRPGLGGVVWGTQERLSWRAADGLELDGLLILPPGRSRDDGPFPLVTMIHGGPDERWADELAAFWALWGQWLAAAGFAVFSPNPRGGAGHGQAFATMVVGAVGQDEWTDTLAGLDQLIADGVADPDRLGIGGWSHGGFMAAWAVTQTNRFRAAVMGAGIADWAIQVAFGEQGRYDAGLSGSLGWEGPGPHRHDQLSPISYAANVITPVLILNGEDDTNVPVAQAMYFHRALTQFGVEHDLVIYPRENHLFTERAHQIDVLERVRSWFTRWLGDPADG
jgi:dipeptidyl aminopeptidase/acylaminoacyl peptidase